MNSTQSSIDAQNLPQLYCTCQLSFEANTTLKRLNHTKHITAPGGHTTSNEVFCRMSNLFFLLTLKGPNKATDAANAHTHTRTNRRE